VHSELERLLRATAHRFPEAEPGVTARAREQLLEQWRSFRRTRGGWLRRGAVHVALAVAVAASFGVGKMTAASPRPISAQPAQLVVERGTHAVFHGRIPSGRADEEVRVLLSRCGDAGFVEHRRVATTAEGRFRTTAGPIYGRTKVRFVSGRSRSGVFEIGARALVTLAYERDRGGVGVAVYAGEAEIARRALVQRFDRARERWTSIAVVPLERDVGFFSGNAALEPRAGDSYRAVLPSAGGCLSQSASSVLYVDR
jgi:hypothetical protein